MKKILPGAVAILLLAGCSSPDTTYFILSNAPPSQAASLMTNEVGSPQDPSRSFVLGSVSLPASTDHTQILRLKGPNIVELQEYDLWAAPLDSMFRKVLSDDLATRLGPCLLTVADTDAVLHARHINVTVDRFDLGVDGAVTLAAHWVVTGWAGGAQPVQSFDQTLHGGRSTGDAVAAVSVLTGRLADAIALQLPVSPQ